MKSIYLVLFFLLAYVNIYAQDNTFQDFIPRTPNAGSLGNYGDVPVSYHTGVPNINIPIYEVKEGPLTLPVSLSYHSSGIKVKEVASWVGLGWSLNAGGVISRTIMGGPDEGRRGFPPNVNSYSDKRWGWYKDYGVPDEIENPYNCDSQYSWLNSISGTYGDLTTCRAYYVDAANGLIDTEPDLFTFNFNGNSGKFFFDEDRNPVIIPWEDYRIEVINNESNNEYFNEFIITTPDGIKYYFGGTNSTEKNYYLPDGFGGTTDAHLAGNTWYLYKIESVNNQFNINLSYVSEDYGFADIGSHSIVVSEGACTPILSGNHVVQGGIRSINSVKGKRLSGITTSSGNVIITFEATHLRQDLSTLMSMDLDNIESKALTKISIAGNGSLCKEYELSYDYFVSNTSNNYYVYTSAIDTKRLKLLSIKEKSCDGTITNNPYVFTYNESVSMTRRCSLGFDYWGYYNGQDQNAGLIPELTNYFGGPNINGQSNRIPSETKMKAWILEKITYPTGGYTSFNYEAHRYNEQIIGGLRIKKITKSGGGQNPVVEMNYTYSDERLYTKNPYVGINDFMINDPSTNFELDEYICDPGQIYGCAAAQFGWIVDPNPPSPLYSTQGYHIGYMIVTESNNDGSNTQYIYGGEVINYSSSISDIPKVADQNLIGRGFLKQTNDFDNSANLKRYTDKSYQTSSYAPTITVNAHRVAGLTDFNAGAIPATGGKFAARKSFEMKTMRLRLASKISKTDGVGTTQYYTYDPNNKHNNPISIETRNSNTDTLITFYKYPSDPGSGAPAEMYDSTNTNYKHMLSPVVQSEKYVNGQLTSKIYNQFTYSNNNVVLEKTKEFPTGTSEYKENSYQYDSKGNLISINPANGVNISYLWAYNNVLPVAKIENATFSDVLGVISQSNIDALGLSSSESYIRGKITDLRNGLTNSEVTGYIWESPIGINVQIDPNGNERTFEYDYLGRLDHVKDNDGYIKGANLYHFKEMLELIASPSQVSLSSSGQSTNVNITSNVSWTVTDDKSWISTNPTSGSGNASLGISVTANGTTNSRYGIVTISDNSGSGLPDQQVSVTQSGVTPYLTVSTTELLFGGSETHTFTVSSNTDWIISITYYDENGWLSTSPSSGNGNATIYVTSSSAMANNWEAEIQVYGGGIYRYIDVVKYY